MKPGKVFWFGMILGLVTLDLGAQTWELSRGPRSRDSLPLPVLWASDVWEAEYSGGGDRVRVYGLGKAPFILEGGKPLDCPGIPGRRRDEPDATYVHVPAGFLLVFPRDYGEICTFLSQFLESWEELQQLSYYRGLITLPHRISPGTPQP